jgi:hypothetical protein
MKYTSLGEKMLKMFDTWRQMDVCWQGEAQATMFRSVSPLPLFSLFFGLI